jgi:hypothetical protein
MGGDTGSPVGSLLLGNSGGSTGLTTKGQGYSSGPRDLPRNPLQSLAGGHTVCKEATRKPRNPS